MRLILLLILVCLVMMLVVMTVMYRRVRKTYGEAKFTTWLTMKSTKNTELMLRVLCADNGHRPYSEMDIKEVNL